MNNNKIGLGTCVAIGIITLFTTPSYAAKHHVVTAEQQSMMSPDQVLQDLIDGNKRFYSSNKKERPSLMSLSQKTHKYGQFPKAVILACMDSRSAPEIIFDQSIGDIFTLRVAGNIVNDAMLASLEYATKHSGSKLIVIMGHTQCGAIEAVCKGGLSGNLKTLAHAIEPAVMLIGKQHKQLNCSDDNITREIAMQNVRNMVAHVIKGSEVIRTLLAQKKIKIVGALHNLKTGVVTFE